MKITLNNPLAPYEHSSEQEGLINLMLPREVLWKIIFNLTVSDTENVIRVNHLWRDIGMDVLFTQEREKLKKISQLLFDHVESIYKKHSVPDNDLAMKKTQEKLQAIRDEITKLEKPLDLSLKFLKDLKENQVVGMFHSFGKNQSREVETVLKSQHEIDISHPLISKAFNKVISQSLISSSISYARRAPERKNIEWIVKFATSQDLLEEAEEAAKMIP